MIQTVPFLEHVENIDHTTNQVDQITFNIVLKRISLTQKMRTMVDNLKPIKPIYPKIKSIPKLSHTVSDQPDFECGICFQHVRQMTIDADQKCPKRAEIVPFGSLIFELIFFKRNKVINVIAQNC